MADLAQALVGQVLDPGADRPARRRSNITCFPLGLGLLVALIRTAQSGN